MRNSEEKRLSVVDAAVRLGVSKFSVLRYIHSGRIHAVQVGRHFSIPVSEVEKLLVPRDFSKGV